MSPKAPPLALIYIKRSRMESAIMLETWMALAGALSC
jgi:hypothetical protein